MARDEATKTHYENVAILPNSTHGDDVGDNAFAIYAPDADPKNPGTPVYAITNEGTVSVGASGGSGNDFTFYGDTSGAYILWDASDNRLEGVGPAYLQIGETTTGVNSASPNPMIYGRYHGVTTALTGDGIGVRGNARLQIASTSGTLYGGYFQAGNDTLADAATAVNVGTLIGALAEVVTGSAAGSARAVTDARGLYVSMDINQADTVITTAYGIKVNFQASSATAHGTLYGLYIENEAVGGNGQEMDSAIYIKSTNHSAGVKGWTNGIDFSGATYNASGAEIKLSNAETIDNLTNGTINLTATTVQVTGSGLDFTTAPTISVTASSGAAGKAITVATGAGNGGTTTGFAGGLYAVTTGAGTAGTTTGGAGGAHTLTCGNGGTSTTGTSGAGGAVTLTAGTAGLTSGAGTSGAAGAVTLQAGASGNTVAGTGAAGGAIGLTAGASGTNTTSNSAAGGGITLTTGASGTVTTGTSGAAGTLTLLAGNSGNASSTGVSGTGGGLTFTAGNAGTSAGGATSGAGGAVSITAGNGGGGTPTAAGNGGALTLTAGTGGTGTTGGNGGNLAIYSGAAGTGGSPTAGTITVKVGGASGTAVMSAAATGALTLSTAVTCSTTLGVTGITTFGNSAHAGKLLGSGTSTTAYFDIGATGGKAMSFYFGSSSNTASHVLQGLYINTTYGTDVANAAPSGDSIRGRAYMKGDASGAVAMTGGSFTVEMAAGSTNSGLTVGSRGNIVFPAEVIGSGGAGNYYGVMAELYTEAATDLTVINTATPLAIVIGGTAPSNAAQLSGVPLITFSIPANELGDNLIIDDAAAANAIGGKIRIRINGVDKWLMYADSHD